MTEHHHGDDRGMLTRIRVELLPSTFCYVLMLAASIMAGLLFLYVWPFSRPALLIPMFLWTMYLVNKSLVSGPVLNLIDEVAERVGFYPVHEKPAPPAQPAPAAAAPAPAPDDVDLEDHVATVG
jgi:hypothetical protein